MGLKKKTLGCLSCLSFLGVGTWLADSATAQCVQADISVQYNISGSREPTERVNDVEMQSRGSCRGNASVTTGVQGNQGGTSRVNQNRVVRHRFEGEDTNDGSPTVQIRSNPTIDVYNPADRLSY
ncbi:hypothetical protein IQ238_27065 [Pleurocapsales cyanobacterium LEGE 06147]|nr:hypothetical protein [Pleurocapsales cyanobacterium LEGE 06147]